MARLAKSLETLRRQVNERWPNRDKSSDGWIGDPRHAGRTSDHNPNRYGVVTAIDLDADLSPTENIRVVVDALFASKDRRIKYIIFEGRITTSNALGELTGWKEYKGANPHDKHAHVSVSSVPLKYDDDSDWNIGGKGIEIETVKNRLFKQGDRGADVQVLQAKFIIGGYLRGTADGIFGPKTKAAVTAFQSANGLREDGLAGEQTLKELGL